MDEQPGFLHGTARCTAGTIYHPNGLLKSLVRRQFVTGQDITVDGGFTIDGIRLYFGPIVSSRELTSNTSQSRSRAEPREVFGAGSSSSLLKPFLQLIDAALCLPPVTSRGMLRANDCTD